MTDTAQLAIFIRGVDENFTIHEELAALYPMKETTRGEDVFLSLKEVLQKYGLKFNNLAGIATDGAPSMVGKNEGLVALIRKHFDFSDTPLMQYHCIIHQVHLCAKKVNFEGVMKVVVKTVNFIKSKGLNHRDFQTFLEQMESEYGDVLYYSEVRWLSRGKMLDRVFQLKDEIKVFMSLKGKDILEFSDPDWLCDFGFLVDITKHLNNLNLQLQGKNNFIHDLFGKIRAFEMKLKLFKSQLKDQNFAHFPALKTCDPVSTERYVLTITDLETHFDSRFSDFKNNEFDMKVFYSPFNVCAEDVNETIQMELIDFQSNPSLKEKFTNTGLIEFYSKYLKQSEFPNIYKNALRMASLFGSTYICEQFFTQMKIVKSKTRTKITDRHLENTLRIATTKMDTDIDNLVNQMQHHLSH
uniref:General transcription factor II-I repeat domain-containing protein 2B n=4 Tax=Cacopsylla melanoneura TaxID=428564 RepID=A0A8D8SJW9_9HEMI